MAKVCNGCGAKTPSTIPYVVHEAEVQRLFKIVKRQWIAIIVAISLLFTAFALFVWYESQFETITYEQDSDGINNVNYGRQGGIEYGTERED